MAAPVLAPAVLSQVLPSSGRQHKYVGMLGYSGRSLHISVYLQILWLGARVQKLTVDSTCERLDQLAHVSIVVRVVSILRPPSQPGVQFLAVREDNG
jgi:hypothetical protein